MIKEIKIPSNLYTFHIQKCTGRVNLDQSTSEAHAKLNAALEMWNRTVSKRRERKEGEEAAAATPAGTTGVVALLGKGCFFFVERSLVFGAPQQPALSGGILENTMEQDRKSVV